MILSTIGARYAKLFGQSIPNDTLMRFRILVVLLPVAALVTAAAAAAGGGQVRGASTWGALFPSTRGADRLPDGFLVQATTGGTVYQLVSGKKSPILPAIFDRWVREMHYFEADVVVRLPASELARYQDGPPHNTYYWGKILTAGSQRYYIDDQYRKRPISAAVQAALKYPSRNAYDVPASFLAQFQDGPSITRTDVHPGGTVMYLGPYHGGILYLIRGGTTKQEFLSDYVYEAMGFNWSSQILPVSKEEITRYKRGVHLSTYPDGVVVGARGKKFLVQGGKLRWIANDALFQALGLNPKYVFTVLSQYFKNYGVGQPVTAFKRVRVNVAASTNAAVGVAGSSSAPGALSKLPASKQALMKNVNSIFLQVHDRNPTPAENRYWIAYINDHDPGSEAALAKAMEARKK